MMKAGDIKDNIGLGIPVGKVNRGNRNEKK